MLSPSLRKAAVLISTLDEDAADALLRQMSADDAAKVRSALVELNDIAPEEQREVLAEFLRQQGAPAMELAAEDDVALELDPAVEAAAATTASVDPPAASPDAADDDPLAFLIHVDPKAIAALLCREHPQMAAVVVAHLPAQQAAAVLQHLPAAQATEALERIAGLDELAPEIRSDLARELRRQLAPHFKTADAATASLAHLTAVIDAMDFRQRQRVVLKLGERNTPLLRRLGLIDSTQSHPADHDHVIALRYRLDSAAAAPNRLVSLAAADSPGAAPESWLTFDDLVLLDDAALRTVFAAADTEISLLALTGAQPRLLARILRKLPTEGAAALRRRLEHPGPIRLRDIEQARSALAAVASRLAQEGAITLPPTARFAAAV